MMDGAMTAAAVDTIIMDAGPSGLLSDGAETRSGVEPANSATTRARLAALERYGVVRSRTEPEFDDIVMLASQICHAPTSLVSFVGDQSQWFEARVGCALDGTPLSQSVCQHGLDDPGLLIVPDLTADPRTQDNPLVVGEPYIRFYAGAPLVTTDGIALGMLCVIDTETRTGLTPTQRDMLLALARQVMTRLTARRTMRERDAALLELKEREASLRESEAKLKAVLEAVPVGIVRAEAPSGRITEGNPQAALIFGHPVIHSRDVESYRGWVSRHADGRQVQAAEYPLARVLSGLEERPELEVLYQRGDATEAWIRLIAAPIRDDTGRVTGGVVASLDIDREKRAEAKLQALNDDLEIEIARRTEERDQLWRMPNLLLAITAFDGTILVANPGWPAMIGWAQDELVGRPYVDLIHPDDAQRSCDWVSQLHAGSTVGELRNRLLTKDGATRSIAWMIRHGDGGFHFVGRDVTAEEHQAQELARTEEQLRQAQKMEAVGQLTGGIAHDFNNLLTIIMGSLEMVGIRAAQGRTTELDRFIDSAQGAARRAATLIQRLLAFSRRQTLEPKPTDVGALVNGMEDMIRRSVGPAIQIGTVNAAGLWTSLIDPNQLESAVLNLCINARDAMPEGGKITIQTDNRWMGGHAAAERGLEPGQYISLCVSDTGTGMSPEVVAKACEPFFTTKPIGMGSGLGLSMIHGFARQSGGTVSIDSALGQGSTVCIYLPRHLGQAYGATLQALDPSQRPTAEQGEAVLVIDDEPSVRTLVGEVLFDMGCRTIEASDGAEGLAIVDSDVRIDLLITDIGLPGGMNGRQIADRARLVRPGLKVLFITGYAEPAVLSDGLLDPGMQVVTKPFDIDRLASRIEQLLPDR